MEITEVRIKLTEDSDDRLQAFCSITFDDCFVVRDLKIIEGSNGPFVAMPSRKLTSHCSRCGCKNHLRAGYCNQCGTKLNPDRAPRDAEGRAKLYADIAHPINSTCRESIQDKVIAAYRQEVELSKQPGYVSRYDEDYEDDFTADDLAEASPTARRTSTGSDTIHRTDAQSTPAGPPAPHTPAAEPPATIDTTPPSPGRRKAGFGAGILDD
ncbi:MAG: septation protein SpoVG family protein [Pirellulaceae bacterium]